MNIFQRIHITALAFVVGIILAPLAPFAMAWIVWGESDDDGEDGQ